MTDIEKRISRGWLRAAALRSAELTALIFNPVVFVVLKILIFIHTSYGVMKRTKCHARDIVPVQAAALGVLLLLACWFPTRCLLGIFLVGQIMSLLWLRTVKL